MHTSKQISRGRLLRAKAVPLQAGLPFRNAIVKNLALKA